MGYYDEILGFNPVAAATQENPAVAQQRTQNLARFQQTLDEAQQRLALDRQQAALKGAFGQQLMGELLAPATEPYNPQSAMPGTLKDYAALPHPPMVGAPQSAPLDVQKLLREKGFNPLAGAEQLTPDELNLLGINVPYPKEAVAPMTQPPATQYVAPPPPAPKQMLTPQTLEELALMQQLMPHLVQRRGQQETSTRGLTSNQFRWNTGNADRAVRLLSLAEREFLELQKLASDERVAKAKGGKGSPDDLKYVVSLASQWNSRVNSLRRSVAEMESMNIPALGNDNPNHPTFLRYLALRDALLEAEKRGDELNVVAGDVMAGRGLGAMKGGGKNLPTKPAAAPPPAPGKKIRVRWNGQTGTIDESEFDPATMERLG